jgi:8-oxo-dGTP pyrophosphatase MutT (NUDIX family)
VGELGSNQRELVILDLADGTETVYTQGQLLFQGWAPDSQHFLFRVFDPITLYLGEVGEEAQVFDASGELVELRWLDASNYLALFRAKGAWEIHRGELQVGGEVLVQGSGSLSVFDFSR